MRTALQLAAGLLVAQSAVAQVPSGGIPLLAGDPLITLRVASSRGAAQIVPVEGAGFSQAIRVTVTTSGNAWDVELRAPVARAVSQGDVGFITFSARAARGSDETGEAFLTVYAQKASPDWDKSLHHSLAVGPAWQTFAFPFKWGASYDAGQSMVAFGLGSLAQTVDIGGIAVLGFGREVPLGDLPQTAFSYGGREADAPWRADAAARIDAIRKGPLVVEVLDADDRPIEGMEVRIEMRRHAFAFGSAIQAQRLLGASEDSARYRESIERLFNAGSLENDLKWPPWAGDWGPAFNVPQTLAALEWLRARGMHLRGHVLVWPGWSNLPRSVQALRGHPEAAARIPPLVLAHIDDVTRRTAPFLDEWDVVNEPFSNHDLMDLAGSEVMRDWFVRAREHLPGAGLFLNDYDILSRHGMQRDHQDHFERTARALLDGGAPITGLGMQGHFGGSPTSLRTVERVLDRFAALGLAIRITEFDVDTADEQLQADYTRDFLTMVFSHPAVVGFQMWGFWEGAHWRPQAAMYRRDWSEKPNGEAFRRLVHDEWRTRGEGLTDRDGRFTARAFYGRYEITVSRGSASRTADVDHRRGGEATIVRVRF